MKQAVVKIGGTQHLVTQGQTLTIDRVDAEAKELELNPLLVINGDDVQVGNPVVEGVVVKATVTEAETKGPKLKILKFKPKKRIKRQTGHRQKHSLITIDSIS